MSNGTFFQELQNAFNWGMISCPQFDKMLYHNSKTGEYESGGKIIAQDDPRLIDYLEMQKTLKPVNLEFN